MQNKQYERVILAFLVFIMAGSPQIWAETLNGIVTEVSRDNIIFEIQPPCPEGQGYQTAPYAPIKCYQPVAEFCVPDAGDDIEVVTEQNFGTILREATGKIIRVNGRQMSSEWKSWNGGTPKKGQAVVIYSRNPKWMTSSGKLKAPPPGCGLLGGDNGWELSRSKTFAPWSPAAEYYTQGHASEYGYDPAIKKDEAKAAEYFMKAAELGHPDAAFEIFHFYERGLGGLQKNDAEAIKWLSRCAELGHPGAQWILAQGYESGRAGLSKDVEKATLWYQRAAAQGHYDATERLKGMKNPDKDKAKI